MAPRGVWGCFALKEVRGSSSQSWKVLGCSALGIEEGQHHNLVLVGMSPWRGGCCGSHATDVNPPAPCVGVLKEQLLLWGVKRLFLPSDIKWWMRNKQKRKSLSGSFHQQFTAMTTMPVLPPLLIPVHPLNSAHRLCSQVFPSTASLNKTLQ